MSTHIGRLRREVKDCIDLDTTLLLLEVPPPGQFAGNEEKFAMAQALSALWIRGGPQSPRILF